MTASSLRSGSVLQRFQNALPTTFTFIPKANAESLAFLLASAMLGRFALGVMRCAADWPTLNTKKDDSEEDKVDTLTERVFMEFLGVPANFLAIALGQDTGFKLAQALHKSHPEDLMKTLRDKTPESAAARAWLPAIERSLYYSFNKKQPLSTLAHAENGRLHTEIQNPLYKNLYEQAKVNRFTDAMAALKPGMEIPANIQQEVARFFKWNNIRTNSYGFLGGMLFSTVFSGFVWQWLNDHLIRKRIVPPVVKATKPLFFPAGDETHKLRENTQPVMDETHRKVLEMVSNTADLTPVAPSAKPPQRPYQAAFARPSGAVNLRGGPGLV